MLKGLYGITSDLFLSQNDDKVIAGIEASCSAGLNILQYRQKSKIKISIELIKKIRKICHQYQTVFIINDSIKLAIETQADGVHLGKNDGEISNIRQQTDKNFIIGASCYNSIELALTAQNMGASYVAFGAMFPSTTKPNAPLASIETVTDAKQKLTIPTCVIGGITRENIQKITPSNTDMVAIVSDIFNQPDIFKATQQLKKHLAVAHIA